jgi:Domain of Unknown Function (DUF1080)
MSRASAIAIGALLSASALLGFNAAFAQPAPFVADGKSLDPFDQVGTAKWRVAEQAMASSEGQGFLVTKQPYDNFRLRLEYWADEGTNSGVFIRCADPKEPTAQSCYEINIFDENPNRANATGAIVGVKAPLRVPQSELRWNLLEIEAKGQQLNVSLNNERTVSVRDAKHARGYIALQRNAGVIYFKNVQIQPLTAEDIANLAGSVQAICEGGFGVIFPGEPQVRDTTYTTASGKRLPAKEWFVDKNGNRYGVTSVQFTEGPYFDPAIVQHAAAELSKKGEVRTRNEVEIGLGRPGVQLNIFTPNGRQVRASAYMGSRRLIITQAEAALGDIEAVQFEQSVVLINGAGNDIDRVNPVPNAHPPYDCR